MDSRIAQIQKNFEKCQQTLTDLQKEKSRVQNFMKQIDSNELATEPSKVNISTIYKRQTDINNNNNTCVYSPNEEILAQCERLFHQVQNDYQLNNLFNQQFISLQNFNKQLSNRQYEQLLLKMINFSIQVVQQQQSYQPFQFNHTYSKSNKIKVRTKVSENSDSDDDDDDYYRTMVRKKMYGNSMISHPVSIQHPHPVDIHHSQPVGIHHRHPISIQNGQPNLSVPLYHHPPTHSFPIYQQPYGPPYGLPQQQPYGPPNSLPQQQPYGGPQQYPYQSMEPNLHPDYMDCPQQNYDNPYYQNNHSSKHSPNNDQIAPSSTNKKNRPGYDTNSKSQKSVRFTSPHGINNNIDNIDGNVRVTPHNFPNYSTVKKDPDQNMMSENDCQIRMGSVVDMKRERPDTSFNRQLYNSKGQIEKHYSEYYDVEDIPKQRMIQQNDTIRPVIEQQALQK